MNDAMKNPLYNFTIKIIQFTGEELSSSRQYVEHEVISTMIQGSSGELRYQR